MRTHAIHPERTAIARGGPSTPTRLIEPRLSGKILDYGAGRGADTKYLKGKGCRVEAYDPYFFPQRPSNGERFRWILLNYVLNVIPSRKERSAVLSDVHHLLEPGGHLLVAVRARSELDAHRGSDWVPYRDGWVTGKQTFQHGYTQEELKAALAKHGFKVERFLTRWIAVAEKPGKVERSADARTSPFGKQMPQGIYLHRSLLGKLPPAMRNTVRRARSLLPHHARWNILKYARDAGAVSFLWYPGFDEDPHPSLRYVYRVEMKDGVVKEIDHHESQNPFILHRKETFVSADYSRYPTFARLSRAEEGAGLLSRPDIGTKRGWEALLDKKGYTVRGHTLQRSTRQGA